MLLDKLETMKNNKILRTFFPELDISGYTSIDGTVEFYSRINSILDSSMTVLDYGAGRGAWFEDDVCAYRKSLRQMKGKVKEVIGCDIDSVVLENRSVDRSMLIGSNGCLPIEDASIDLIICDWAFEHIAEPAEVAKEFRRVLKVNGWICARTPNKYSYVSLLTRLIKNSLHVKLLRFAQPGRKEIDVFPTTFKLNSFRDINNWFDPTVFFSHTYRHESEPAYFFNNKIVFLIMLLLNKLGPHSMKANLYIFLRKKPL